MIKFQLSSNDAHKLYLKDKGYWDNLYRAMSKDLKENLLTNTIDEILDKIQKTKHNKCLNTRLYL